MASKRRTDIMGRLVGGIEDIASATGIDKAVHTVTGGKRLVEVDQKVVKCRDCGKTFSYDPQHNATFGNIRTTAGASKKAIEYGGKAAKDYFEASSKGFEQTFAKTGHAFDKFGAEHCGALASGVKEAGVFLQVAEASGRVLNGAHKNSGREALKGAGSLGGAWGGAAAGASAGTMVGGPVGMALFGAAGGFVGAMLGQEGASSAADNIGCAYVCDHCMQVFKSKNK